MTGGGTKTGMTPPHPGTFIRIEALQELGLSVSAAARILAVRRATLSDLVNGNASLSPEMALRVEKAFGLSMDLLLRMQAWHDATQMRAAGRVRDRRRRGPRPGRGGGRHPGVDRAHRAHPRHKARPDGRRAPRRPRHHPRMARVLPQRRAGYAKQPVPPQCRPPRHPPRAPQPHGRRHFHASRVTLKAERAIAVGMEGRWRDQEEDSIPAHERRLAMSGILPYIDGV